MLGREHLNPDVLTSIDTKVNYFHEKDLNNSNFVLFFLNKILYFHSQVNKFQNDIYFNCNCVFVLDPSTVIFQKGEGGITICVVLDQNHGNVMLYQLVANLQSMFPS